MTTPSVDRAALHAFLTGSSTLGQYPSSLYDQVEKWREACLAETKARGITVHLTGSTTPPAHGPTATLLEDCAAQCSESWPDRTRTDGMQWTLPQSIQQIELCCRALDAADNPAPSGGGTSSGWSTLPVMTSAAVTGANDSHQSAVPTFQADGMHVKLPASGGSPGPGASAPSGSYQRAEAYISGWDNLTGTLYLRYDFTLLSGFPTNTSTWQTIAQCKNSSTGSPPLELMVGNKGGATNAIYVQWHSSGGSETGTAVLGAATTGVQHCVVLGVQFSTSSSATVSGWLDGKPVFTNVSHGPTLYSGQTSYGKCGIYRDAAVNQAAEIVFHSVAQGATFASVTT